MKRREFITLLGGAAAAWPQAARAQQALRMRRIGVLMAHAESDPGVCSFARAKDTGYVEGENVAIEYRWAENQLDRLPMLVADLIRRKSPCSRPQVPGVCNQAATTTIPVVFLVPKTQSARSCRQPRPAGRQPADVNIFLGELVAKRLELLRLVRSGSRGRTRQSGQCCECRDHVERRGTGCPRPRTASGRPASLARSTRPSPLSCGAARAPFSSATTPFRQPACQLSWRAPRLPRHISA
jgi:hypothetical protein